MAPNGARKRCMQECCHGVTSCFVKRVQCFCVCFFYTFYFTFYFTHQGSTPIGKFECGTGCSAPSCASQALNQLDQPGHHLRFSSGFLNSGWQARKDAIRRPACSGLHILPIRVRSSPSLSFGNRSEPNSLIPWTHTNATTDGIKKATDIYDFLLLQGCQQRKVYPNGKFISLLPHTRQPFHHSISFTAPVFWFKS